MESRSQNKIVGLKSSKIRDNKLLRDTEREHVVNVKLDGEVVTEAAGTHKIDGNRARQYFN